MRVGVTGGNGFIGQYLIRDYGGDCDFVVPVRKTGNPFQKNACAAYVESDYSVESLKEVFEGCDAVIHLAARGMPKGAGTLQMADYIQNVTCAASVFEACKDVGIKRIICASTKSVYGTNCLKEQQNIQETDAKNPNDEYGVSKLCVETLAEFYCRTYGMKIVLYRMPEVCGIDLSKGMQNPFWAAALQAVLENRPIPVYGTGAAARDLIYVKDVTRALMDSLQRENVGAFNIASGGLTTNKEIALAFCEIFESAAGIELHPEKKEWGTIQYLDASKAQTELDYRAEYSLRDIVQDIKIEYEFRKG